MATVYLTPQQFPKHLRWLGKQLERATMTGLRSGAQRGRALLVKHTPKGVTGVMRNAWRVTPSVDGVVIENDAPYAAIVELGARPHPVSPEGRESIRAWVLAKLDVDEGDVDRVTDAIVWRIRTVGQAPTYFVRGLTPRIKEMARQEVERLHRQLSRKRGPA